MNYKNFKTRDEMIEALCQTLNLTKTDVMYKTEGSRTIIVFKSIKKLDDFFERLDYNNVAAQSMTSYDFGGGFIVITSGKSACIEKDKSYGF